MKLTKTETRMMEMVTETGKAVATGYRDCMAVQGLIKKGLLILKRSENERRGTHYHVLLVAVAA